MGELLRKLKIDGEDFERNNEDTLTSIICFTRPRRFRTPRRSLTIQT